MEYSYSKGRGTGSKRDFSFHFEGQDEGYIREEDITVFVEGDSVPFSFTSSNTVSLDEAPHDGADVLIRRIMPKDLPYADFKRGNNFGQETLNNSFLQLLYIVHEILDGWFPEDFTVRGVVDFLEGLRSHSPDPSDPKSVVNFEAGDARYVEVQGDTMQGSLNMDTYPVSVRIAVNGNEPARKDELDAERTSRQAADANLQAQISGGTPIEASAFSPISWHKQVVENSVVIPDDVNAWSFGPTMSIVSGQSVTVSDGSYWTIANGEVQS